MTLMTMYSKSRFNFSLIWKKSLCCFNLTNYLKFDEKCPKHIVLLNLIIFINSKSCLEFWWIAIVLPYSLFLGSYMHGQHDLQNLYSRSRRFIDFEHVEFSSLPKTLSSSPEQRSGFPTSGTDNSLSL